MKPVFEDGGPEPEILAIWPISPCVICGEWPEDYHARTQQWYAVRESTIERAKRGLVDINLESE